MFIFLCNTNCSREKKVTQSISTLVPRKLPETSERHIRSVYTIHSSSTDRLFGSTYKKGTLKVMLVFEYPTFDKPLSTLRCVYEYCNQKAF